MPLTKPHAILFDWDNTLADTWPIIHKALSATLVAMGREAWSIEDVRQGREGIHQSLRDSFPRLFGDKWEDARAIYYKHFLGCHLEELGVLPGVEEVLKKLKGTDIYVAIVSNKTGQYLRDEVDHLGWNKYFRRIVGATDAPRDKPHPDPVFMALADTGIAPGPDVWFIGDSETDLETAGNAGCTPLFYGDGNFHERFLQQHGEIRRLRNHRELLELLETVTALNGA